MAKSRAKSWPKKLLGLLAFTYISAFTLILIGILFIVRRDVVNQSNVVEYSSCKHIHPRYASCANYFTVTESSTCDCIHEFNISTSLEGKVNIYTVLGTTQSLDSRALLGIKLPNAAENCISQADNDTKFNITCQPVPNDIFKDIFLLKKFESESSTASRALADLSKSDRWSSELLDPASNVEGINIQNKKISVLMKSVPRPQENNQTVNIENGIQSGNYQLIIKYYRQEKDAPRYLIFFTIRIEDNTSVVGIVSLVIGLILLALSIVLMLFRKRIQDTETNNSTAMIPSNNHTANNNGQPRPRGEEKPLSSIVNTD